MNLNVFIVSASYSKIKAKNAVEKSIKKAFFSMKVLLRAVMVIEFYQQRSTGKRKHYRKCRVTKREYNIILQDLSASSVSFI